MRKIFLPFCKSRANARRWRTSSGRLTALLAVAAFYPAYTIAAEEPKTKASVVVSTPGKQPVNIVAPTIQYLNENLNPFDDGKPNIKVAPGYKVAKTPPKHSMKPIISEEQAADTKIENKKTESLKEAKDKVFAKAADSLQPAAGATETKPATSEPNIKVAPGYKVAKTPPKYSMKPIVADEPPEEFLEEPVDTKEKAKPETETKKSVKKEEPKKAKEKTEVKKDKKAEKPAEKAAAAKKSAEKPKSDVKPKVVKVEENKAAIDASKAKAAAPAAKVVEKEVVPEAEAATQAPKTESTKVEAPKAETKKTEVVKKETPKVAGKAKVEYSTEGDIEKLKFTFTTPVAAAVFERFGFYWLVFYTEDQVNLPEDLKKSKLFSATKKLSPSKSELISTDNLMKVVATPLIFNLELNKKVYAVAQKSDNVWELEFDPGIDYKQEGALSIQDTQDSWQIAAKGLTGRVTVKDEFTNDYVEVFPLLEPGFLSDKTTTAKFISEKSVQGLVLKTIGQAEIKSPEKDKLVVYKGATVEQTAQTTEQPVAPAQPTGPTRPLYAFQKWQQLKADDYRKQESKLRDGDRIEFGKFLFSQGLYAEAAVNLQGQRGTDASFLTGASYYMLGRYDESAKIFDSLILPPDVDANELLLWKAAAQFDLSQVKPSLSKPVDMTGFFMPKNLDNYPDEIRNKLIFSIAEKQTADGKYDDATKSLSMLPKSPVETPSQSYMKYLQGKIFAGQNKKDRAREIWAEVVKAGTDRESQAKSNYEIIIQDYNAGRINAAEAIQRLNDIRILWRGDVFEYTLLSQLSDLYLKNGDSYEALATSKEVLSSFPNFPHNLVIANKMRELYQKELTANFADKDKAFRALTIYYEFEELKPPGEQGDQLTLQLADALARFDLLTDAVKVLKKYADKITDPAQKAEIGTRIAILNYLNNKPKDALDDLKNSNAPNLPNYLVQERRILEVRCLIEVGDLEKAQSMLSSLPDEQAFRFKADIAWHKKDWAQMIDSYVQLTQRNDEDIMRMGIGYVMLEDKKASQDLAKRYGEQMEHSPYAQNFLYVTDVDNVDYRNLDASLKLDKTEELLQKYRDRIKKTGLDSVTGAGNTEVKN